MDNVKHARRLSLRHYVRYDLHGQKKESRENWIANHLRTGNVRVVRVLHTQGAKMHTQIAKRQKDKDIQQLKFAGGHPLNYYAAGKVLKYARADGMACFHFPVVVYSRLDVKMVYKVGKEEASVGRRRKIL